MHNQEFMHQIYGAVSGNGEHGNMTLRLPKKKTKTKPK